MEGVSHQDHHVRRKRTFRNVFSLDTHRYVQNNSMKGIDLLGFDTPVIIPSTHQFSDLWDSTLFVKGRNLHSREQSFRLPIIRHICFANINSLP